MAPILGIYASQITGHLNPFTPTGDYDALATYTVPSGGVSSITFAGLPTGGQYSHLQIRCIAQTDRPTYSIDNVKIRFNADSGSNYSRHALAGNGGSAYTDSGASQTEMLSPTISSSAGGSIFGAFIVDVLDYASSSKYKTIRALGGEDVNGTLASQPGYVAFWSGAYLNTSAINSINLTPLVGSNFTQYTQFAIYGVK